jgi:hypothetical protein
VKCDVFDYVYYYAIARTAKGIYDDDSLSGTRARLERSHKGGKSSPHKHSACSILKSQITIPAVHPVVNAAWRL